MNFTQASKVIADVYQPQIKSMFASGPKTHGRFWVRDHPFYMTHVPTPTYSTYYEYLEAGNGTPEEKWAYKRVTGMFNEISP